MLLHIIINVGPLSFCSCRGPGRIRRHRLRWRRAHWSAAEHNTPWRHPASLRYPVRAHCYGEDLPLSWQRCVSAVWQASFTDADATNGLIIMNSHSHSPRMHVAAILKSFLARGWHFPLISRGLTGRHLPNPKVAVVTIAC